MALLYLETNYLMGVATGRYPEAPDLLNALPQCVTLCLPTCCLMEALAALEGEQSRRNSLTTQLDAHLGQLKSGIESSLAMGLVARLNQVRLDNSDLVNEIQSRLFDAINVILPSTSLIESNASILARSLTTTLAEQPTDNLILHTIIAHALLPNHAQAQRVFFTGNLNDFRQGDAGRALVSGGVKKFFQSYKSLRLWLASPAVR